jgi:hypothetical protein
MYLTGHDGRTLAFAKQKQPGDGDETTQQQARASNSAFPPCPFAGRLPLLRCMYVTDSAMHHGGGHACMDIATSSGGEGLPSPRLVVAAEPATLIQTLVGDQRCRRADWRISSPHQKLVPPSCLALPCFRVLKPAMSN